MDTLYIVNTNEHGKKEVLGSITNLNNKFLFLGDTEKAAQTLGVAGNKLATKIPLMLSSRTYSPKRKDISKLLERHGLKEFNVWELVKRTEGSLATDNLRFVTHDKLEDLGLTAPRIAAIKVKKHTRGSVLSDAVSKGRVATSVGPHARWAFNTNARLAKAVSKYSEARDIASQLSQMTERQRVSRVVQSPVREGINKPYTKGSVGDLLKSNTSKMHLFEGS